MTTWDVFFKFDLFLLYISLSHCIVRLKGQCQEIFEKNLSYRPREMFSLNLNCSYMLCLCLVQKKDSVTRSLRKSFLMVARYVFYIWSAPFISLCLIQLMDQSHENFKNLYFVCYFSIYLCKIKGQCNETFKDFFI